MHIYRMRNNNCEPSNMPPELNFFPLFIHTTVYYEVHTEILTVMTKPLQDYLVIG